MTIGTKSVRQRGGATWIFLALGLSTSACSSSSSSGAAPPIDASVDSTSTGGDASSGYAASACGVCVAQACSTQVASCANDPDCSRYLSCLDACPVGTDGDVDESCASACPTGSSSSGMQAETALTACRDGGEGSQCASCGGDSGADPLLTQMCPTPPTENMCATCEDQHCCNSTAACDSDAECKAFKICIQNCVTEMPEDAGVADAAAPANGDGFACDKYCQQAHPNGIAKWASSLACAEFFCSDSNACASQPLDTCQKCIRQECPNQWIAVNETASGLLFSDCISDCPNGANACTDACNTDYPDLSGPLATLDACSETRCPSCSQ